MNRITNEQREAVVRKAVAERDALLGGKPDCAGGIRCSNCPGKSYCKTGCIRQTEAIAAPPPQALTWRKLAANWLRAKADAQERTNRECPEHVKAYPSWETRVTHLRWDADEAEGKGGPWGAAAGDPAVLAALSAAPQALTDRAAWKSVSDGLPEDGVQVQVWRPMESWMHDASDCFGYDMREDGVWLCHHNNYEEYMAVGGPNAAGPGEVCTGPSEQAPYTHWRYIGSPRADLAASSPEAADERAAWQFKLIDAAKALQHAAERATPEVAAAYKARAAEVFDIVSALASAPKAADERDGTEFSGRIVEVDYERSSLLIRYEGLPPEVGASIVMACTQDLAVPLCPCGSEPVGCHPRCKKRPSVAALASAPAGAGEGASRDTERLCWALRQFVSLKPVGDECRLLFKVGSQSFWIGIEPLPEDEAAHFAGLFVFALAGAVRAALAGEPAVAAQTPYTDAIGQAGQRYADSFPHAHPLPALWRWEELWNAMRDAARAASQGEIA